MDHPSDTIAAVATPPGRGGVGMLRISGPLVNGIATALLGRLPAPRYADYRSFRAADGGAIDHGLALYFPAPHSYTGEHVLELHGHGGPMVMDLLLQRVLSLGARPARPGEFTERAFLNGKLDLAQAEAVADLIDSSSHAAARSALRSLEGEFSTAVRALVERLIRLRMYVESAIDFPEEEIDFLSDGHVAGVLQCLGADVGALLKTGEQGRLLRDGMTLVIAGRPNAGKSSLLNQLAQRDTAIVTDIPGTTRDVLREHIHIDGLPLHIVDTAGLRESADPVETQGIQRAWAEIVRADRVLLVVDDHAGVGDEDRAILQRMPENLPVTVVHNKIDLSGRAAAQWEDEVGDHVALSAKHGAGIDLLKRRLAEQMGYRGGEGVFMARRRHLDALRRADAFLLQGQNSLHQRRAGELLAEDLRLAQQALSEITGEFTNEDLLGRIFAEFCIGK